MIFTPNLAHFSPCTEDDLFHIVMQFCEGGTLKYFLDRWDGEQLPEDAIKSWAAQIASAGQYLHDRNILHRDIKSDVRHSSI